MQWHSLTIEQVFTGIQSSPQGLSSKQAGERLKQYGPNLLTAKQTNRWWVLFLRQFNSFMIFGLLAAATVSLFVGEIADAVIIFLIVLLNAVIGCIQEYQAEKTLAALTKMAEPFCTVLRDGQRTSILLQELVPGDIVLLEAGNILPADLRLFTAFSLDIDESRLTGESQPVAKTIIPLTERSVLLADRVNMAYKGCTVTRGRGAGVVINTGMQTEIGRIATLVQTEANQTPLQRLLAAFSRKISFIILGICIILFTAGVLRGNDAMEMLLVAISLAVAAVPEAMPALITIAMARGAKRLLKKQVLVRKLSSVETLGAITYICTDKTGTLTENKMTVMEVLAPSPTPILFDLPVPELFMVLNNDNAFAEKNKLPGDPTEKALIVYAEQRLARRLNVKSLNLFTRVAEIPFDSSRKCMTTIHSYENKFIVVSKGAAEVITGMLCKEESIGSILLTASQKASDGMRVLVFCYRVLSHFDTPLLASQLETGMHYGGMVTIADPPRKEAKLAIDACRKAGIKPVMITGDHIGTAMHIAKELGILTAGAEAITSTELDKLSPAQLDEKVENISVYARVTPEQKLAIVQSLQRKKQVIAMTGDGVNDAPSLKAANIGLAMGISGTEVSKEAADMVLLDDNFKTILTAIEEGRRVYDNIHKFIKYILTCNTAEVLIIFTAPFFHLPLPLLPVHILWINLVTDGLPALALSFERADENIMQRPPRKITASLLDGIGFHILWGAVLIAALILIMQVWGIHNNHPWQTIIFNTLALMQLAHAFAVRNETDYIYRKGVLSNKTFIITILFTLALQFGITYLPQANVLFSTQPLTISELSICAGGAIVIFHAVELEKYIKKAIRAWRVKTRACKA